MKNIYECVNVATPMNTLGAGNVNPLNADPVPDEQIPNKSTKKKKKLKSLKEYIYNKKS